MDITVVDVTVTMRGGQSIAAGRRALGRFGMAPRGSASCERHEDKDDGDDEEDTTETTDDDDCKIVVFVL